MRGGDLPQSDKSSHLRVSADKEIVTLTKPGSQLKQGANINNINDVFIPLQSKVNPFPSIYTLQYRMLTRKTSYCVIWYFGRCFSKQEIDMFVVIQCHL